MPPIQQHPLALTCQPDNIPHIHSFTYIQVHTWQHTTSMPLSQQSSGNHSSFPVNLDTISAIVEKAPPQPHPPTNPGGRHKKQAHEFAPNVAERRDRETKEEDKDDNDSSEDGEDEVHEHEHQDHGAWRHGSNGKATGGGGGAHVEENNDARNFWVGDVANEGGGGVGGRSLFGSEPLFAGR